MNTTNSKSVNWTLILSELGAETIRDFARGELSGRGLYREALDWSRKASPEVRKLLRSRNVDEARQLARKALSRRQTNVDYNQFC